MKTVIVEVNQNDIDRGLLWNAQYCPVANALRRALPFAHRICGIIVGPDFVDLYHHKNGHRHVMLGPIATAAISDFDHGEVILPFTFTLNVPREIMS